MAPRPSVLARWRALAPGERRLLREALFWFLAIRVALRLLPFARVARWAESRPRVGAPDVAPERIGWATAAIARRVAPPRTCLAQALTAQVMLGKRGRASTIRFGARKDEAAPFRAHAWLECDGAVLVGGEVRGDYVELREQAPDRNAR